MGPHRTLPLAVTALLALGVSSCATDLSPVYIDAFLPVSVSEGFCSPDTDPISAGVLDTGRDAGYVVGIRIQNALADNSMADEGRINSNRVIIDTAHISYRFIGGSAAPPAAIRVPLNLSIDTSGHGMALVNLLTAESAQSIAGQEGMLVANVSVSGKLASGQAITSSSLDFTIELCVDCVFQSCEIPDEIGPSGRPAVKDGYRLIACSHESLGQPDGYACVADLD